MTTKIVSQRRSNPSSSAAVNVAGNEDLITEILLRLPPRSLIRFNSVSKQWSSLISDPQFSRNHILRRNPGSFVPSALFFYNSLTKSEEIESVSLDDRVRVRVPSLSFLDAAADGAKIKIIQSCNGLLLCHFTSKSKSKSKELLVLKCFPNPLRRISAVSNYCVCNPTTKKYKMLPQPILLPREHIIDFGLAFDPWESPHYRIACVKTPNPFNGVCEIDTYSSEDGFWRRSACRCPPPSFDCRVYWNGLIHWIIDGLLCYFAAHFDFSVGVGKLIRKEMLPIPAASNPEPLRYFGEFRGRLHLIYVSSCSAKLFNVLEKDRETLNWSVKYRVDISGLLSDFPEIVQTIHEEIRYAFCILCVFTGEKEEDSALVLTIPGKVVSYNFKRKTSTVLCELPPSQVVHTSRFRCVNAYNYMETLSPL